MAFRRKKIKHPETNMFITSPVMCSFCKEVNAYKKIHGSITINGGRTCCDSCYPELKKREDAAAYRGSNSHYTEADYQTWMKL